MPVPDRLVEPSRLCDDSRAVFYTPWSSGAPGERVSSGRVGVRLVDEHAHRVLVLRRSPGERVSSGRAGVRLVDEHAHRVVVLRPDSSPPGGRSDGKRSAWRSASALRALAVVLILLGGLTLLDAGVTLVWQEPISALYAKLRQDHLNGALQKVERAPPTASERRTLASLAEESARIAFLARELQRHAGEGSPVGRIVIPRLGASYVVVNGTGTEALESGPGLFRETSFPGIPGTTAIAGHRTTFLAPFRHIDALTAGNAILLHMPYADFTYSVTGRRVVAPTDVRAAVGWVGHSRLVLSACTPLFSAAKRLLVYATLTRTVPEGAARTVPGGGVPQPIEASPALVRESVRPSLPAVLESLDPHVVAPVV
jgi:sortase A